MLVCGSANSLEDVLVKDSHEEALARRCLVVPLSMAIANATILVAPLAELFAILLPHANKNIDKNRETCRTSWPCGMIPVWSMSCGGARKQHSPQHHFDAHGLLEESTNLLQKLGHARSRILCSNLLDPTTCCRHGIPPRPPKNPGPSKHAPGLDLQGSLTRCGCVVHFLSNTSCRSIQTCTLPRWAHLNYPTSSCPADHPSMHFDASGLQDVRDSFRPPATGVSKHAFWGFGAPGCHVSVWPRATT